MTRRFAVAFAFVFSACGVAETGILLSPPPGTDGGSEPGDVIITVIESFGRAPVGGQYTAQIELENVGADRAGVELLGIEPDVGVFGIDGFPVGATRQISPGGPVLGLVRYRPNGGEESATLRFNTCAGEGSCLVQRTIRGFGVEEAFRCEGGEVGTVEVGRCAGAEIACTNETDYEVSIRSYGFSGSTSFFPLFPPEGQVGAGETRGLGLELCPGSPGPHRGTITIASGVPEGENHSRYEVAGEGIGIGSDLTCAPETVVMGPLPPGSTDIELVSCRATRDLWIEQALLDPGITERLQAQLLVNGVAIPPPFSVTPADRIEARIIFTPSFVGDFRESLLIQHDGGEERVDIEATAIGMIDCQLDFAPVVAFGTVPFGEARVARVVIANIGTGLCSIESIGLSPMSDPAFELVAPSPTVISAFGPGESIDVTIRFTPSRAGLHTGGYQFLDRERGTLYEIALEGEGQSGPPGYTILTFPNTPFTPEVGTSLTFSNPDDGFASIPIGFPFEFAGQAVSDAWVSTNGVISFDSSVGLQSIINRPIPTQQAPNAIIAWWWEDLHTDHPQGPASSITTTLIGAAPSRVRVITFLNVPGFESNSSIVNAEVRLYEDTHEIEVYYGQITVRQNDYTATIGWESFDGLRGGAGLACNAMCSSMEWPANTLLKYVPTP